MSEEKWGWWGVGLPNRKCNATYCFYPYESLPKISINPLYKDITDIEKLIDFLHDNDTEDSPDSLFDSPTACYFETNRTSSPYVFYVDQQGCIMWCLDDEGRVVTSDGDYVAKTLPEFLTRISLENSIWIKTNLSKTSLTAEEAGYVGL
jgi:hypothetical protein